MHECAHQIKHKQPKGTLWFRETVHMMYKVVEEQFPGFRAECMSGITERNAHRDGGTKYHTRLCDHLGSKYQGPFTLCLYLRFLGILSRRTYGKLI